ncbi:hypothetical protein RJ55_07574 [Drechmeria coniospora]|nr:hypothetical protein RJ55_07574 [Drechmeria coniospora]
MSTMYQSARPPHDGRAIHGYHPTAIVHPRRPKALAEEGGCSQQYRYPSHAGRTHLTAAPQAMSNAIAMPAHMPTLLPPTVSDQSSQPSTPSLDKAAAAKQDGSASQSHSDALVFHSLQLPKCISPNGGNLSDFAAQMTCLFWFDSVDNLRKAESVPSTNANLSTPRLPNLAKPYEQFRKWVYNVLSTTQVTQNVIFLALLFIYRLKLSTPQIKGRAGSEYRLLTVALMLGNKFLDDNTYTNKTWAEVSCFAVQEIHVMEVEFLSNMRYNLLASKQEWENWLGKLANFREHYERALKLPASPIHIPSPTKVFHSPLASPTGATQPAMADVAPHTPSAAPRLSPSSGRTKNYAAYQADATSPLAAKPVTNAASRKRSSDDDLADYPSKRHVAGQLVAIPVFNRPETSRLPVPQLTMLGAAAQMPTSGYPPPSNAYNAVAGLGQHVPSLPPLQAGARAVSSLYVSSPTTTMAQLPPMPTVVSVPGPSYPVAPLPNHAAMGYGTPTKHQSPGGLPPFGSSPMAEHLGPASAVHTPILHTPISNSPSVYLQQRASPYKPVRHVNKLLYPPPSASLDQYHLSVPMQPNQMHYQPLGRRYDVRTGVVPEFLVDNRVRQRLPAQAGQQGHYPS